MKYKSEKTLRRAKKAFSLIELMIVIVIIGALTAIILPQFDISEAEAKDAGCDASNYGTLSQLTKFRSVHSAYPSRMHTGLEATSETEASDDIMGTGDTSAIPSFTFYNMRDQSTVVTLPAATFGASLNAAGIVSLAYGGFSTGDDAAEVAFIAPYGGTAKVLAVSDHWYEEWTRSTSTGLANEGTLNTDSGTPISINGVPLPYYMFADPQTAWADGEDIPLVTATGVEPDYIAFDSNTMSGNGTNGNYYPASNYSYSTDTETLVVTTTLDSNTNGITSEEYADMGDAIDGIVVPLILAPTTDWEHYYDDDGNQYDSKIQVAQVGACPWLEGGAEFRYYIGIFKLYANGSKAKLLGTMCPEGGSLNP